MARRRKGNPVDGWLVIDKPAGVGSTQVVSKARWALRAQKAGHAGTLDPLATGSLAVAFGEATKTVPYVMDSDKHYRFTVRWGAATDTDDAEGQVIATSEISPSAAEIEAALPGFTGEIMQVPPTFSAVKVEGERAYDLARGGTPPALAARPLTVERLVLLGCPSPDEAEFEMVCGKGGYVRSIARDLGAALGCYGHVVQLRRLRTGPFSVEDAVSWESLDTMRGAEDAAARLLPVAAPLAGLPCLSLTEDQAVRLRNGQPIPAALPGLGYGSVAWAAYGEAPVAIGTVRGGLFYPKRILHPVAGR